jgi:hypothetical protein
VRLATPVGPLTSTLAISATNATAEEWADLSEALEKAPLVYERRDSSWFKEFLFKIRVQYP